MSQYTGEGIPTSYPNEYKKITTDQQIAWTLQNIANQLTRIADTLEKIEKKITLKE